MIYRTNAYIEPQIVRPTFFKKIRILYRIIYANKCCNFFGCAGCRTWIKNKFDEACEQNE